MEDVEGSCIMRRQVTHLSTRIFCDYIKNIGVYCFIMTKWAKVKTIKFTNWHSICSISILVYEGITDLS